MGPAGDHEFQVRRAGQFDDVLRVAGADVHLQLHVDFFLALQQTACDLMDAGGLPRGHFEKFGFHRFLRDHGLDRLGNIIKLKAERVRHHGDRFRQAVMLDHACRNLSLKFLDGHSRPDFLLQR